MLDKILELSRRLFPTGRAFKIPYGGVFDGLVRAISTVEADALDGSISILNSILPDNDFFDSGDAEAWELRLGIPVNTSSTLEDRKAAILRKMNHPGTIPARQNYRYIQRELNAAGFDVIVYENRFNDGGGGYETRSPDTVGMTGVEYQLGMYQLGGAQLGTDFPFKVANYLDAGKDIYFNQGAKLRRTFFISGDPIASQANVPLIRETEFRELILKLKPAQTVAFLNINYT